MSVTDESQTRAGYPSGRISIYYHFRPGKPHSAGHLHGREEQVVNVFSRVRREGFIVEVQSEKGSVSSE